MFNIEELRKNNRTSLFISSFAAQIAAMAVLLMMVLGSPPPWAHPPQPQPRPQPQDRTHTPPVISG